jgi:hypothetical protein
MLAVAAGGCVGSRPSNPAATQPVTVVDPQLAEPDYWLRQPGVVTVSYNDFTRLWEASEDVARSRFFKIDRREYRAGRLTTVPMVSKQWFEFLRKDAVTEFDVRESSLGPIRRTIYFEFVQEPGGVTTVTPKVLVERQSRLDPKYRGTSGDPDAPVSYWYALRRDAAMEQDLADAVKGRLYPAPQ